MAGKHRDSPFAALATLKQASPAPAQLTAKPLPPPAPPAQAPADAIADDVDFRRAIGKLTRVMEHDRAELSRPRPAPVPRPRRKHEAGDDAPLAPKPGARLDPLTEAYAGVTRLRTSDRAEEIGLPRRYHTRPLAAEMDAALADHTRVILPPVDSNDPAALFRAVVGDARPLTASARLEINAPRPLPVPRQRQLDEEAALAESLVQGLGFDDRLDSGEEDAFLRPGLRRRVLTDLRRGRWTAQDKIDLHGLNRDEARAALSRFLSTALAQGKRCIRVIHGKGLGSPGGVSILKQLSRSWLAQREEILAFCQANPHEGGAGALLVLLRAPSFRRS
ncbi:hypothetical protein AGMMS49960_11890 [Betaproteobacteria bacterium]|nr:hypothetical protein AGMMS49543_26480 [Betaproteobacteria bacterium]GHU01520.1 hypothetical protein AGMMS49960_11890 [Betaproteobacteria bacterium]GHU16615.1 hypothetical protein AGMMS50243_03150 [Betaproteobacteria bacterium]